MHTHNPYSHTDIERTAQQDYDHQQQKLVLTHIIPVFLIACWGVAGAMALYLLARLWIRPALPPTISGALFGSILYLLFLIALLSLGWIATKRGHILLPTIIIVVCSMAGTSAAMIVWGNTQGLDPFGLIELTPYSIAIVIAGMLLRERYVFAVTACMNGITVLALFATPENALSSHAITRELPMIAFTMVMYEWIFALLIGVYHRLVSSLLHRVGVSYERAKHLDALKDAFITSMNHELRTPLASMSMLLAALQEGGDQISREQQTETLAQLERITQALTASTQTITSLHYLEAKTSAMEQEPFAIADALDDALLYASGITKARMVTVHTAKDLIAIGNRAALAQVLTNLLTNAVKYSAPSTAIVIDATRTLSPEPVAQIAVKDYGLGIPVEHQTAIFNRFVRLPRDLASSIMGNGIGLYLCSVQMAAMHGVIWVESDGIPGQGSTFFLQLPIAE